MTPVAKTGAYIAGAVTALLIIVAGPAAALSVTGCIVFVAALVWFTLEKDSRPKLLEDRSKLPVKKGKIPSGICTRCRKPADDCACPSWVHR